MSFDLGPVKRPMIQESQNMQNNGGGGNLGYLKIPTKKKIRISWIKMMMLML